MIELTPEQVIVELRKELEHVQEMRELGQQNYKQMNDLRIKNKSENETRLIAEIKLRQAAEQEFEKAKKEIYDLNLRVGHEKQRGDDNYDAWCKEVSHRRAAVSQRDALNAKVLQQESDLKLIEANLEAKMRVIDSVQPIAEDLMTGINSTIDLYNQESKWLACLKYALIKGLKHEKTLAIMSLATFVFKYPPDDLTLPEDVPHVTINVG